MRILLLTDGDNNPWPQRWLERRLRIRPAERRRWGERRHKELLLALARLGLDPACLVRLGWPDLGITDRLLGQTVETVSVLSDALGQFRPNLVAMPSLDDRHPDHGSSHVLMRLALAGQADSLRSLTYLIHGHVPPGGLSELVGTQAERDAKQAALEAHASQMALSAQRMRRLAARPECYGTLPPGRRASACALPWRPPAWMRPWLRLSVVGDRTARSWRWSEAPLFRAPDGAFHLALTAAESDRPRFARLDSMVPSPWIFDGWGWQEV